MFCCRQQHWKDIWMYRIYTGLCMCACMFYVWMFSVWVSAVVAWSGDAKQWMTLAGGSCPLGELVIGHTHTPLCYALLQLTLVRCNQQVQRLLRQVRPNSHHLFSQLCIHLVLVCTAWVASATQSVHTRINHLYTHAYIHTYANTPHT